MSGHHRHDSETPFKWRFAGGPMLVRILWHLDPLSSYQLIKKTLGPLWQNFLGPQYQPLYSVASDFGSHCLHMSTLDTL